MSSKIRFRKGKIGTVKEAEKGNSVKLNKKEK